MAIFVADVMGALCRSVRCSSPSATNWPRVLSALVAVCGMSAHPAAHAGEYDWFNLIVGASVTREDNLFRLPSGADPQAVLGRPAKSDWLYTTNVGLKVDKPYSLQRFQLDMMATDHRFQSASHLDYTGFDYRGAWLWQLTPKLSGVLSAERKQSLASFADYRNFAVRNVQTIEIERANADWWIEGGWHLLGGVTETRSRNSQVFTAVGDFDQTTAEASVRYVAADESSATLTARQSRGRYQGRPLDPVAVFDNRFDQQEIEGRGIWVFSAQSRFDGRLGYLERKHANFSQRDFSGPVGRLDYIWTPSAKLRFEFSAARNLYSFQEPNNSFYVASTLAATPKWLISEKTTAYLQMEQARREYRGAVAPTSVMRADTLRSFAAGGDWKATRDVVIGAEWRRETRDSNIAGFEYVANIVGLKAQLMF